MKKGIKAIVSEFAETPMEGVTDFLSLVEQEPINTNDLEENDVLIEVKSCAVGWVDLMMLSGQYQHQPPLPYTPGLEYSGTVLWKGKKATNTNVGDKILVDGLKSGPRSPGNYQKYGGFATYAVAPENAVLKIPDNLSFDEACNILGNYETAYYALITAANIQKGESVLIHGASGSTGLAAVHIAKKMGATVIATGRSDEKLAIIKQQGADFVINTKNDVANNPKNLLREQVKELTDGKGVDVVYDGVGGDISVESLRCVKFGARFLIIGWASTPFVAKGKGFRGAPNANQLPTNLILMKGLHVIGSPMVIATQKNPEIRKERLKNIFKWIEDKEIRPYVSTVFELKQIKEAMKTKWSSNAVGGIVIRP